MKSIEQLKLKKQQQRPISMVTCYDFLMASIINDSLIDCVLVGDSVGTNHLGYSSEQEVRLTDMIYHTKAVARGIQNQVIISDLPYQTYTTPAKAVTHARQLINAGAQVIKFEGFYPDIVTALKAEQIACAAHLGLLPQTAKKKTVQASDKSAAELLIQQAKILQEAGADMLIVELIPEEVAQQCSQQLSIPVIGIAAGRYCDGQVQVIYDVLGLTKKRFKHVPDLANLRHDCLDIFNHYHQRIDAATLLDADNSFHTLF